MVRLVLIVGLAGLLAAGASSPLAAADPFAGPVSNGESASATVDDLTAQGYNVVINWTTGYATKPLSECWVRGVNNPGNEVPTEGSFTTVYVDVACPNGDDGSGFTGGVGIGIG